MCGSIECAVWQDTHVAAATRGAEGAGYAKVMHRARGVHAYHLQVREQNPALRLYERAGMKRVPRLIMSKKL